MIIEILIFSLIEHRGTCYMALVTELFLSNSEFYKNEIVTNGMYNTIVNLLPSIQHVSIPNSNSRCSKTCPMPILPEVMNQTVESLFELMSSIHITLSKNLTKQRSTLIEESMNSLCLHIDSVLSSIHLKTSHATINDFIQGCAMFGFIPMKLMTYVTYKITHLNQSSYGYQYIMQIMKDQFPQDRFDDYTVHNCLLRVQSVLQQSFDRVVPLVILDNIMSTLWHQKHFKKNYHVYFKLKTNNLCQSMFRFKYNSQRNISLEMVRDQQESEFMTSKKGNRSSCLEVCNWHMNNVGCKQSGFISWAHGNIKSDTKWIVDKILIH